MSGDPPVVGVGHGGEIPGNAGFFHLIADIAEKLPVVIGGRLRALGKVFLPALVAAAEVGAVVGHDVEAGQSPGEEIGISGPSPLVPDAAHGGRFVFQEGDGIIDDLLLDAA